MYSSNNNLLHGGYPQQRQEQYQQGGIQQQLQQPQQQQIMNVSNQIIGMHHQPQYQQRQLQPQQQQIMNASNQINGVHELQYQQLYYRQQQQQLLMDGDGYPASQIGTQVEFFANHQQQINPKQIKSQILFICLEARQWQRIVCDQYDGSFMYVRSGADPNSPDLTEGIDVVRSRFIYGGDNSRTISECYKGLFTECVLNTELGRRYLQHSLSIVTDLEQQLHDERILLQRINYTAVILELRLLIAEKKEKGRQHLERNLQHERDDGTTSTNAKRQRLETQDERLSIARQKMEDARLALISGEHHLKEQQQQYQQQVQVQTELDQQLQQFNNEKESGLSISMEVDQDDEIVDKANELLMSLSLQGGPTPSEQDEYDLKIIRQMCSRVMNRRIDRVSDRIKNEKKKEQKLLDNKVKAKEERDRLAANAKIADEQYKMSFNSNLESYRQVAAELEEEQLVEMEEVANEEQQLEQQQQQQQQQLVIHQAQQPVIHQAQQQQLQAADSLAATKEEQKKAFIESTKSRFAAKIQRAFRLHRLRIFNTAHLQEDTLEDILEKVDIDEIESFELKRLKTMDMALMGVHSETSKQIGEILLHFKSLSGYEIGQRISDLPKHELQLSVMPIATNENQAPEAPSEKLPPLAVVGARGSSNTNNDCTSQSSRCMIMLRLLVDLGVLPKDTEVLNTIHALLETDRRLAYRSPAFHLLLEFLHNLEPNRLVIFTIESILRIGETPELVSKLLLIMIKIHPNIKLLTVADFALHPVLKAEINAWYSYQYSSITADLGCNRGAALVGSDEEATLLGSIHTKADEIADEWDELNDDEMPPQIRDGIVRGKTPHPKGKEVGKAVKKVVEKVLNASIIDLPLDQQPGVDINAITNKAITKHIKPITGIKNEKKVVIITRRTKSTSTGCAVDKELFVDFESDTTKSKFGVPVKQFTHCIAAGRTFKYKDEDDNTHTLIDDETELIVIFADDTDRKELYKELVETAMAHICDGDVLAVIAPTTIRVTAIRELFKPVQLTCNQTNTMLIMAEESTERMLESMENENKRQNKLTLRRVTLKTKERNIRKALPNIDWILNTFASNHISKRRLDSSQCLFQSALKYVLENNLGSKSKCEGLTWEERVEQLKAYKQVEGHCNVPQKYEANPQLGLWVATQRRVYKKGKLSKERIESLQGIGFEWELRRYVRLTWEERFNQLLQFKEKFGHCNVTRRTNKELFSWVDNMRQSKKGNGTGKISHEQIERLTSIGFRWEKEKKKSASKK